MSIISNIKNLFPQKQLNASIFSFLSPTSLPKMGEREYLKAYKGWVYACTNAIAERIADIDIKLQQQDKDGDWKDIDHHDSIDILKRVNDFYSFYDLLFEYAAYQELSGNVFWYLVKSGSGKISEIWSLNPVQMSVVKSEKNFISGYVLTTPDGQKIPFDANEIIHFKRFDPNNPYRGMGTVQAADVAIDTDTFAAEWQRNFFGNAAVPAAVLSTEGTLNQDQYDRIRANWDSKYKGVENAHKMAILEGNLKYTAITPTARDMQFTEGRKTMRDEILAIFRVPKVILGITEDVNYASAEASEYVFAKYVIKPKMKLFISKLNEFYLPLFNLDSTKWRFDFVDPVPENLEQKRADRESGIKNFYMTPNEARAEIGLEPIEGGDELFIPTLVAPLSQSNKPEPDKPTEEPTEEQDEEDQPKENENQDKSIKKKLTKGKVEFKPDRELIDSDTAKQHTTFLDLNSKLEKQLLENLKENKSFETKSADDVIKLLFQNYQDWIGLVYNASKDHIQEVLYETGKKVLSMLEINVEFDVNQPRVMDWLNENAMKDSTSYADSIKEEISLRVQQGIEQGASNQKIAKSISGFFDDQSDWRALRIARTETINAYGAGALEGYKQSNAVSGKFWIFDGGNCESGVCERNADEGVIGLDEEFSSGDLAPTAHPNCECSLGGETARD